MSTAGKAVLHLDGVVKRFGGVTALDGVSIEVPESQIVGIIGPNGAGKTTVFNVITGAYRPTAGNIRFLESEITGWASHRIAQGGISRTFQNIRLFSSMTVWEHLLVAQLHQGSAISHLLPPAFGDRRARERAEEVLTFFGLEDVKNRLAQKLPYGIQRRVEMARAVTAGPKVLLLDEPVAGMNRDEAANLQTLLRRLRDEMDLTILLIEHDMTFVMAICEYLYVLDFGSLISQGEPSVVRRDQTVLNAYLGDEE